MRIAIFSDYFYPELGGIQDSIEALATTLARRGHQLDLWVPRYSDRDYRQIGADSVEVDWGKEVGVHRRRSFAVPSSTKQSRLAIPSPLSWLWLLRSARPDVIHTHSFFGMGLEALLVHNALGVPIVGTYHTAIRAFERHVPVRIDHAIAYARWYYNQCDLVTAPSKSAFDDLSPVGLRRPQRVISNPVDTATFAPDLEQGREAARTAFGLPGFAIVYAGRLGAEKNIDTIFRALSIVKQKSPSVGLVLAGHGSHEPQLRSLAADLQITSNVKFLGTLKKHELSCLFSAADLFVIMSTSETQSMSLLQAMSCGLPVIGANARALPEYINGETGLVVDPYDHAALAATIQDLVNNRDHRLALGRSGVTFARQFSIETVADQWEATYMAMTERRMLREVAA